MKCWRYLPADSINSTPQAAAEYVAWALWEAGCPLPDVFYAATLAAVKFRQPAPGDRSVVS